MNPSPERRLAPPPDRGSALIFSYLAIAMLVAYGSTLMIRSAIENRAATMKRDLSQAFQWAEAGLDDAMHRLSDPTSGYWSNCTALNASVYTVQCTSSDPYRTLRSTGLSSLASLSTTPLSRQVEAMLRRFIPPDLYDNALYAAGQIVLNGNAYSVAGDVLSGSEVPITNTDNVVGDIVQDPAASPLPALDFAQLYALAQSQGNVYDAARLAQIQQNQDAFPASFCYDGGTAPDCVPNVNYVTTDLLLNGNIGTIGGLFVVVGNVLTDPEADDQDAILNGNGQVEGVIYTTGQFRINGGGGNLNISGAILAGSTARLNGNCAVDYNAAYLQAIEDLHISPSVQTVFWRECPPTGC